MHLKEFYVRDAIVVSLLGPFILDATKGQQHDDSVNVQTGIHDVVYERKAIYANLTTITIENTKQNSIQFKIKGT